MKKANLFFIFCAALFNQLYAAEKNINNASPAPEQDMPSDPYQNEEQPQPNLSQKEDATLEKTNLKTMEAFTGKVVKSRVRLRLQPHLDSPILKELEKDDYLVITGSVDDFYAVLPSPKLKAYIFRTYVLDGVVEGNRVNVRLEPDTTSPVLCQMNSGDTVKGEIASQNSKWLEIAMPEDVRFYVAKEYVTRAGDKTLYSIIEKRRVLTEHRLQNIEAKMQEELNKPFKDIKLAPLADELNKIGSNEDDLPRQREKAENLLKRMQEAYLQKSISNKDVAAQVDVNNSSDDETEHKLTVTEEKSIPLSKIISKSTDGIAFKAREQELVKDAIGSGQVASEDQFYSLDQSSAEELAGILKPNARFVKNMPGDFLLINPKTELPLAYLYSTKVDLSQYIGKEVHLTVSERPNNNFAYPAYFVLDITQ